jgi:hypothetical protein
MNCVWMRGRLIGAALIGVLVSACSGAESEPSEVQVRQSRAGLKGTVDLDARHVVALCIGEDPSNCSFSCSGELLGRALVVTARHCVSGLSAGLECARDLERIGTDPKRVWVTPATVIDSHGLFAQGEAWHEPSTRLWCGHDVALLTLAKPFESEDVDTIAPSFDEKALRDVGSSTGMTMVGYGLTGPGEQGGGTRRTRVGAPVACIGKQDSCKAYGGPVQASEFLVNAQACPGDSGGSAILSGVGRGAGLAGVLSRTIEPVGECGVPIYTSFRPHALWLARVANEVAKAKGYPEPNWLEAAQTAGNSDALAPRAQGSPCDGDEDCASGMCRSDDRGLQWICSAPCPCGAGLACKATDDGASACFPADPVPQPSCAMALNGRSTTPWTVTLGVTFAIVTLLRYRRKR